MDWYERIQKWYRLGLWTVDMVLNAVNKGKITAEQYNIIVNHAEQA